jgi:hypothetical protein
MRVSPSDISGNNCRPTDSAAKLRLVGIDSRQGAGKKQEKGRQDTEKKELRE